MAIGERILVFTAIFLSVGTLAISLTTLLHESWIHYNVTDASYTVAADQRHYEYYARFRGLIWVCVSTGDPVLSNKAGEVKFGRCFDEQYKVNNGSSTEMYVINLKRTHLGLKAAAIFVNVVGLLVGFTSLMMWCMRRKSDNAKYRRWRGHVVFFWVFAVMLALAAMSIYHYVLDIEKYLSLPHLPRLYVNWPALLKANTKMVWGAMYYLEWATICGLALAAFFLRESVTCFPDKTASGKGGTPDDRTYLYHSNPMMQLSAESLPPYDAYKGGGGVSGTNAHTDDGQSARSAPSTRLPRYAGDSTYDNQAKNVYRIY